MEDLMERTVPETVGEGIELYIRTYYSLLRSSGDVRIRSLEETHEGMLSSLHLGAESPEFDASAFLYAALRLPEVLCCTRRIVLGQAEKVFIQGGLTDINDWQRVDAPARRRRMLYNGKDTIAAFVSSVSDIDDLIPALTAFQIEWNKLHQRLAGSRLGQDLAEHKVKAHQVTDDLRKALELSDEDFDKLHRVWAKRWEHQMAEMAAHGMDLRVSSLASGFNDYRKAVQGWWDDLLQAWDGIQLEQRPVYFVSSNPHSIPNLISGHALQQREELVEFVRSENPEGLRDEWQRLTRDGTEGSRANYLYYVQRAYHKNDEARLQSWREANRAAGIYRFDDPRSHDISAEVIDFRQIDPANMDPRVRIDGLEALKASNALIVNVDYPLGFAAYHLLSQVASGVSDLLGLYIMGKAATLNGRVGDVMIPNVVFDEHSRNTFLFKNCFLAQNLAPYLVYGDVFDNQKAVTVRGTFLQNREFMGVFYREGYTDIEMEAGPYMSAIYEDIYPRRYPMNEIVNLFINAPYDIGVLHYASDTPYSRRQSLLSKSLSYFGVDATYACSTAILRRIFEIELARLRRG
jgi:hypothetical protein